MRCFESENIQHVNNKINPVEDFETIKTEILLSDIETINRKLEKSKKKALSQKQLEILEKSLKLLNEGNDLSKVDLVSKQFLSQTGLLSIKPKIIVCNVDETSLHKGNNYTELMSKSYPNEKIITICADFEDQLSSLDHQDKLKFMKETGLEKMGISKLIKSGYDLLELQTFFTSGPEESRAWTIKKNTLAPKAAGVIHTDFEKNFIRAEAVDTEDFFKFGSAEKCKENGKLRIEGKDYVVNDGDVLFFRVNP